MQTITFYSYNGGTGRTLAVANAAKHLVRLGQKVCAIDLDLEAPGLHYKLGLGIKSDLPTIRRGLVDYMHTFFTTKRHAPLSEHTVQVRMEEGRDDFITLMPAGSVPCAEYWHKHTQIDWHGLFYSENPEGIPFFLELKARIEKEFSPDFLLIDSRTGITEIGGVATTILPDRVVCLLLKNRQNLEGSRAVLQGIARARRLDGKPPIGIIPVLARIPWNPKRQSAEFEEKSLEGVKDALTQNSPDLAELLATQDVLVLHTDRSLEVEESLLIGGGRTFDQSPLLRDYLRLFSKLIPSDTVAPHLERLIGACMAEIIDRPEKVQADLEALAENCPHQRSFLALLKFYRVRQAGPEKMMRAAASYWELSRDSSSSLVWDVISEHFQVTERERATKHGPIPAEFIEAVWSDAGAFDLKVGLRLADLYFNSGDEQAAVKVLRRMIENSKPREPAIIASIKKLVARDQTKLANELVNSHGSVLMPDPDFQVAWARLIIKTRDEKQARKLVESKEFRPAKLQADDPPLYVRLLSLTGQTEELVAALRNALDQALVEREMSPTLMEIGTMFVEVGKADVFRKRVREVLPEPMAEHVMQMLPHHRRRIHG
jgi:MinD-like ATPase involved in chromosome partitioning or flagellar assembly